jgi:hypothetical protein
MDIDFLYSKSGKKLAKSPQGINNYRLLFLSLLFPFSTPFLSQKHPATQHQIASRITYVISNSN